MSSRFNPMRPQPQLAPSAAPKLKTACQSSGASCNISSPTTSAPNFIPNMSLTSPMGNMANASNALKMSTPKQAHLNNIPHPVGDLHQNFGYLINNVINGLSAASLANLISQMHMSQLQYLQPNINDTTTSEVTNLSAKFPSSIGSTPSHLANHAAQRPPLDSTSLRLLESLYTMNDDPEEEAIDMIAQRTNSTSTDVANWFQTRRTAESMWDGWDVSSAALMRVPSLPEKFNTHNTEQFFPVNLERALVGSGVAAFKAQPPTAPSSTLLSKLSAVTSRPNAHIMTTKIDHKMTDLLEAFYAINDNPEPAAIEMIAKRINTTVEVLGDWFDEKRLQVNPHAGPRSPPAKKREGGRVVTFSEYQRSLLEAIFDENNYLHPQEYEELSNLIQVPSRNIKIWFKNRRSKQRLSGRITTPGSVNNSD